MSSTFKRYRVDGQHEFEIEYRPESDGTYSIFCHDHPSNPHGDGPSTHHLYASGRVCVSAGREPRTLDRAKAVASAWMNGFSHYVRTGTFPAGGVRVNV